MISPFSKQTKIFWNWEHFFDKLSCNIRWNKNIQSGLEFFIPKDQFSDVVINLCISTKSCFFFLLVAGSENGFENDPIFYLEKYIRFNITLQNTKVMESVISIGEVLSARKCLIWRPLWSRNSIAALKILFYFRNYAIRIPDGESFKKFYFSI